MRLSTFTYLSDFDEARYFVLNTLKRSILLVDKNDFVSVMNKLSSNAENADRDVVKILRDKMVITDLSEDEEINLLHYFLNEVRASENTLDVTMVTTYNCNLNCIYCYENGSVEERYLKTSKKHVLKAEEIAKWLMDFARLRRLRAIKIYFFGGEPLLKADFINSVCEVLEKNRNEFELSYNMSTNGTLLNKHIEILKKYQFSGVAVTIDGPREIHNERRPYKDGSGTYDDIINNIVNICDDIPVAINVTFDFKNLNYIYEFLNIIETAGIKKKVNVNFGPVLSTKRGHSHCRDHSLPIGEAAKVMAELFIYALEHDFVCHRVRSSLNTALCAYESLNSFVLDIYGSIFDCIAGVGVEDFYVGNITVDSTEDIIRRSAAKFAYDTDKWKNEKCLKCAFLPWCLGGCRFYAKVYNGDYDKNYCYYDYYLADLDIMKCYFRKDESY